MIKIGVTIKDVAKKTGLSIATISKYINGGNVLEKNGELIKKTIDELGYTVNEMARGLKTKKTKTIGVVIPNLNNLFFTSIISVIEEQLLKYGYSTIVSDYKENSTLEIEKLDFLINKSVDGIILIPSGEEVEKISHILNQGTPIILIDRLLKDISCDAVLGDNLNSSYNAIEELFIRGHKRVGIIVGPKGIYTAEQRLKGYYRIHEDYSIDVDEELIKYGDYTIESGYLSLKELMAIDNPPKAIYVTNYEMTLGSIMYINECRINIPEDLSFIGFDNIDLVKILNPPISVVVQPIEEIGKKTAALMLKRLSGDMSNYPTINRLKANFLLTESIKKI